MNLIDRYVYAVTQHFHKDTREDVGKELRANIEDMLPENYTDKDVYQVESGQAPFSNKQWSPDDLPEYPVNDKKKISRGETVFSMFCSLLFTVLICVNPQLVALYTKDDNGVWNTTPFFDVEGLQPYIAIIIVFLIIQFGLFIWKYISGSWNVPLAIVNVIYNVACCIIMIVMISDQALFNTEFFNKIVEYINEPSMRISTFFDISKWIFVAVFVVSSVWDSVSAIIKSLYRTSNS